MELLYLQTLSIFTLRRLRWYMETKFVELDFWALFQRVEFLKMELFYLLTLSVFTLRRLHWYIFLHIFWQLHLMLTATIVYIHIYIYIYIFFILEACCVEMTNCYQMGLFCHLQSSSYAFSDQCQWCFVSGKCLYLHREMCHWSFFNNWSQMQTCTEIEFNGHKCRHVQKPSSTNLVSMQGNRVR